MSSPVVQRLAAELGVDLNALQGSGPAGRVLKRDVESAARARPAPTKGDAPALGARGAVELQELTPAQAAVARRMAQSKATAPDYAETVVVDLQRALDLRAELKQSSGAAPSVNDLVVKASALALREHPRAHGAYRNDRWELYERINVGIAVAGERALLVPTIREADRLPLGELAARARDLAARARAGTLTPDDMADATFTVSNLGMFGITRFTAILNPPQAAILAVGAAERRAVVCDGRVVASIGAELTLSCDHRILDGADAAAFLGTVRGLLEYPLRLLTQS
jgi:pyruvate dehydrogenase E2 component (dihydrolipoamide acetyltransferase)